jgi:hypothetical protein
MVQPKVLGERIRDQVRLRFPRSLVVYQRWVRPSITGERAHVAFADWVTDGERLLRGLGTVGAHFERDGVWIEDPRGVLWRYEPGLFGSAMRAEYGAEYELGETALLESLLPAGGFSLM